MRALVAFSALAVTLAAHAAPDAAPRDRLSLSASASTDVTRDVLGVAFSTTREGTDAAVVQSGLKQALDAALAEARKVAKPGQVDVQTGSFSLAPRYEPKTGKITGWINLTGLNPDPKTLVYPYVLNGIAINNETGRLLVTGKHWPHVWEIELVPPTK